MSEQENPSSAESPAESGKQAGEESKTNRSKGRAGGLLTLTIVGAIAGGGAAAVVNHFYPDESHAPFSRVGLTVEQTNLVRADPDDPRPKAINRQNSWEFFFRNSTFALGLLAVILGTALALAEGLSQRSLKAALLLTILSAVFGVAGGFLAGVSDAYFGLQLEEMPRVVRPDQSGLPLESKLTMAMHAAECAIVGLTLGLAFAFLTRRWSAVLRSTAGGLVAGLLFLPLATLLFPLQQTDLPIPEDVLPKLLLFSVAGGLIGFSIGRSPVRAVDSAPDVDAADPGSNGD